MENNFEEDIKKEWDSVEPEKGEDKASRFEQARSLLDRFNESTNSFLKNLNQEKDETREMAQTFFRLLSDKLNLDQRSEPPTSQEVRDAISQLKDVGRFSFFASFSLLPGGGALLIALELLARKYGITWFTFVPSSFRKWDKE